MKSYYYSGEGPKARPAAERRVGQLIFGGTFLGEEWNKRPSWWTQQLP